MKRGILATAVLICMLPGMLFAASSAGNTLAGKAGANAQAKIQADGAGNVSQPQAITPGPVPEDLIVTENGLDWVWGSPCNGGCGDQSPDNQEGWRYATWEELLNAPSCSAFQNPDNSIKCASQYFDSVYSHCDYNDCLSGYVSSIPGSEQPCLNGQINGLCESWYVRGEASVDATAARFYVTKTFDDGATDEVDVELSCNGGLPLTQSFTLAGGDDGVTFVVRDFAPGTDCTVTETAGPDGYTPSYNGSPDPCTFNDIGGAVYTCEITNEADPVEFTVDVEWMFDDSADESLADGAVVEIWCDNVTTKTVDASPDSLALPYDLEVVPEDTCYAMLNNVGSSAISSESDCEGGRLIEAGSTGESCTISAGVFFEGIPTISQYGMAIMALLMLGIGFVGFRRFV